MVSVLNFVGYGPTESLEFFLSRFTLQCAVTKLSLDSDLEKIWICHRSIEKVSQLQNNLKNFDIECHVCHAEVLNSVNLLQSADYVQSHFQVSKILEAITNNLHCCIVQYLITECILLYNWGINSFELVVGNDELLKHIIKYQNIGKRKRKYVDDYKDFRKWRYLLTNQSKKFKCSIREVDLNDCDLFEEEERKKKGCNRRLLTAGFGKLTQIYEDYDKPFCEIKQNRRDHGHEIFNKNGLLYDWHQRSWPENHALATNSIDDLLKVILNFQMKEEAEDGIELFNRSQSWIMLRQILGDILKNHKAIQAYNGYGRILKFHLKALGFSAHCAVPVLKPVPVGAVLSFLFDILRKVIPLEFFGNNRLRKKFFCEIGKIVNGLKNEYFILYPIIQIFLRDEENLPWLKEVQASGAGKVILFKFIKWLLLNYIFLLLKNHFYITEVGSSGNRLYYYRKNDMERFIDLWMNTQIMKKNILSIQGDTEHWESAERRWLETGEIKIDKNESNLKMSECTEYIYPSAEIRFLPKVDDGSGFRIITNYKKRKTILKSWEHDKIKIYDMFKHRQATRLLVLRKVKYLLQFLVDRYGTGIKPLPNNPKLQKAWMSALQIKEVYGKLYYVKADISDAFGSVLPSLLDSIIEDKLKEKCNKIMQMKKIKELRVRRGELLCTVRKSFCDKPKANCLLISRSIFIGIKKKLPSYCTKKLKFVLDQIIYHQYINIRGRRYRLVKGLTQGSAGSLSPLLCEIYFSEMDKLYFDDLMTSNEAVLLRAVDDYLLITSNIEKAKKFYEVVRNGVKDFNVSFNAGKLKSNIKEDISTVHYLGLIFDFDNMSIKPDYSRYESKDMLSTIRLCDSYGGMFFCKTRFVLNRSLKMIPLKLQSITLNNLYNNLSVIREIVFAASHLQACRVLVLTRHVFSAIEKNDLDVCVILAKSLGIIRNLVKRFNNDITDDEMTWLFWRAALNVFKKYAGLFPHLLIMIRYRLFSVEKKSQKTGNDLLLYYIKKEMRSNESWDKVQRSLELITSKCKPSDRFK